MSAVGTPGGSFGSNAGGGSGSLCLASHRTSALCHVLRALMRSRRLWQQGFLSVLCPFLQLLRDLLAEEARPDARADVLQRADLAGRGPAHRLRLPAVLAPAPPAA